MNEKSRWSPTWRTMDKGSWSPGIFSHAYLQEVILTQILGDHYFF